MDETKTLQEIEKELFPEQSSRSEFAWKNLVIGIAVVVIVIFFIYLWVSQSIKSSNYKPMDLSTKNQDSGSVAGLSTY